MQSVIGVKSFNNHEINCNYCMIIKIKGCDYTRWSLFWVVQDEAHHRWKDHHV